MSNLPVYIVLGFFGLIFLAMIVLALCTFISVIAEKIQNRNSYQLSGISALYDE